MGKIVSKLRHLRLEYQLKIGRSVPVGEVADAVGFSRNRLTSFELGKVDRVSLDELERLCSFYGTGLGRMVNTDEILQYEPNNKRALEIAFV